jgi:hypothetical protein
MAFLTESGVNTPTWAAIYESLAEHWKRLTGKELRDNKPEGQFMKAIAEHLSNKGFVEQDVDALWPELEDVFWNGFITTAGDLGMDYLVKLRLPSGRRPAAAATGTAWLEGTPNETISAEELVFTAPDGQTKFVNTRDVTIRPSGLAFFPIRCTSVGPQGNVAEGALTVATSDMPSNVTSAGNTLRTIVQNLGAGADTTVDLPDDQLTTRYQVFDVQADILDSIAIRVHNPGNTDVFPIALALYDHTSETRIARASVQRIVVEGGQTEEVTFSFSQLDMSQYSQVRIVPILVLGSAELVADSAGSGWYEDNIPVRKSIWCSITYSAGGKTSGGRLAEPTYELRRRHWEGLYLPGWGNPETIRSKLMDLNGVMFARIVHNPYMEDRTIDDYGNALGLTLPPKSMAVVVWGGDPEEIAKVIYDRTPAGMELVGNTTVMVEGVNGQLFPVKFSVPSPKRVYARIVAFPTASFPANGVTLIKDGLIRHVGGVDSQGREHAGSPPGQPLFHAPAIQAIKTDVPSIWDLDLQWGYDPNDMREDPLPVQFLEKPIITADDITVILGKLPRRV